MDGPQPIDGRALRPDHFADLSRDELAAMPINIGRTTRRLADLFDIEGDASDELILRDLPLLDGLGAGMESGKLIVECNVGDDLAASMSGGQIVVQGNAGHRVGGPGYGSPIGMTGGEIAVRGNAGDHVGHLMRRGLIAIGGACGKSPGFRMLAGTIVIARGPLDHPGLEMQRGTVIGLDDAYADEPGEHLCEAGEFPLSSLPAVGMVVRRACALLKHDAAQGNDQRIRLWHGDRFELNKGEVMQWL